MRKFNKIFILLAFFGLSVVSTAQVVDSGTCGDNLTWELTGSGYNLTLTISGTGNMADYNTVNPPWFSQRANIKTLVLPDGMTSIGDGAFSYCYALTGTLIIPDLVTTIGNGAFFGCNNLTGSLTISNLVTTIGYQAFTNCSGLTELIIGNNAVIGRAAFLGCYGLISIEVAADNQDYSSENGVLFNKNKTTLIIYPAGKTDASYTIPNSVDTINGSAFYSCGLTEVTIPNSVVSIEDFAFAWCGGLTEVTIPNSVVSIGDLAFAYCGGLTAIKVATDNQYYSSGNGVLFNKNKTVLIQYPIGKTNTSYTIPNSVITIKIVAFMFCENLTEIIIGNSVTTIEMSAFANCSNLTEIIIPNSVITIKEAAFMFCENLTEIIIGNSVTTIEMSAFAYCSNLTEVINLNKYSQNISLDVFASVNLSSATLIVPACALNDYQNADVWSDFGTIIGDEELPCEESSINEVLANSISIYPNPTNYELKVESEFKINNVEICDLTGRVVLIPHSSFLNSINVSSLPQGVYLVKIYTDKGVVTQKVVKK